MSYAPAIGIDLGTSYSCVGVWQNGKVDIIPNDMGKRITPSYVAFTNTERLIGNEAKNQIERFPTNTIFDSLRLIGRKFEDREIQEDIKLWPFKIEKDPKSDRPLVQITYQNKEKKLYAEEICAMILQKLKQDASNFLGKEVKDAIITVPNYFNHSQRQAIKDAGTISGLNVLRIISSSTAASFYYYSKKQVYKKDENVLIFDLGGGTFNVSLLNIEDGLFDVRAVNGNMHLGGEDFDNRLVEYCAGEFRSKTSIDIKNNPLALIKVKTACEKAKKALSYKSQVNIYICNLIDYYDLNVVITRSKFEDLCGDLFKKCMPPLENVIKDAKMSKSQIDNVILVGGSTLIPKIQSMVQEFFNGKEPLKEMNPDESAAYGAAVQAAMMTNVKDEIVEKLVLLDVTPFSLGFETLGGVMNVLIPRNSTIPCRKTNCFTTSYDNQPNFLVHVYEGESSLTKNNNLLGKLNLEGIPPMPKGQPIIEITFDIDANSIINVIAKEKSTGINKEMIITDAKGRLSVDDIIRLAKEAEKFKDEYSEVKKRIEAKDSCEQYCYQIKNILNDEKLKDKFTEEDKKAIEAKINEVLKWMNPSKEECDAKITEVEAVFNPIMYKISQKNRGGFPNFGGDLWEKPGATGGAEDVE